MAQNVIINGVTYQAVPEVDIPKSGGGSAKFFDTSGATGAAADLLTGVSLYGPNGEVPGSMAENGDVSGEISTKAGTVIIPAGHTSGGTVQLKASAIADLISANLLSGKSVLGVNGGLTVPTISQNSSTKILTIS